MIVVVTGSRRARAEEHTLKIRGTLLWATGAKGGRPGEGHSLWDGEAGGVDAICHQLAIEDFGWQPRRFRANWEICDESWVDPIEKAGRCNRAHRRKRQDGAHYCPTAGFRRNQEMIDELSKVDERKVVVGFPLLPVKTSQGTLDCLTRALHAGLPVLSLPLE